jgi:hypothetical protein
MCLTGSCIDWAVVVQGVIISVVAGLWLWLVGVIYQSIEDQKQRARQDNEHRWAEWMQDREHHLVRLRQNREHSLAQRLQDREHDLTQLRQDREHDYELPTRLQNAYARGAQDGDDEVIALKMVPAFVAAPNREAAPGPGNPPSINAPAVTAAKLTLY